MVLDAGVDEHELYELGLILYRSVNPLMGWIDFVEKIEGLD